MGTLCYRSLAWLPTAATFGEFCVFAPSIGFEQHLLEQKTWIITVFWFFYLGGACGPVCPFFLLEFMITTLLLYKTSFTLTAEHIGFCEPDDRLTCGSLAVSVGIHCPELISSLPLWDPVLVLCVCNAFSPDLCIIYFSAQILQVPNLTPHFSLSFTTLSYFLYSIFCYLNDSCICLQVYSILIIDTLSTGRSFILVTGLSLFPRTVSNRK